MKKRLIAVLVCLIAACATTHCYSAEPVPRIGVFDIQKIMKESKVIQNYRVKLAQEFEPKRQAFLEKQKAIAQSEEKLKKESLPAAERRTLEEKIVSEAKELRRLKEDLDAEFQKQDRELGQKVIKEIDDIVKSFYEKEHYSIIFEKNAAGIFRVKDELNITDKIIKLYDKK